VASHKHSQAVVREESLRDIRSKHDTDSSLRRVSAVHVAGVGPKQLDHEALITGLALPMFIGDCAEFYAIFGEESTVADHHFAINHVAEWQMAEKL